MADIVETPIVPEDRTMAALTHLSGLAGYVVPFGGVVVPIIIWAMNKERPIIATLAKQAVWLNFMVFVLAAVAAILMATIILIPAVFAFWAVLGVAAVALPVIGAIKANQGTYYKYPVVGVSLA